MDTGSNRAAVVPLRATTMDADSGPTALRVALGLELRRLRERARVAREEAGRVIRASPAKISRMELGRVGFKRRDIEDLLVLYGVTDPEEHAQFLSLVLRANDPGWWHQYADVLPSWFETYLGLEQASSLIRAYECQFLPGLLQTADYARSVVRLAHTAEREVEDRVELRLRRQAVLDRSDAPLLWVVVDEAVLARPLADRAAHRAQLDHVLAQTERPQVRLQVAAFASGGHPAAGGPFSILRFADPVLPDLVYLEQLTSALYIDKRPEVERYMSVMDRLCAEVLSPEESRDLLVRLRDAV